MATSSSSSPNAGRGADLDAFLLSIALERVTTKRLMLARAAAAAVAPRAGGQDPELLLTPGTVAVPLRSQPNASPFWIMGSVRTTG